MKKLLLSILLASIGFVSFAQLITAFTPRFSATQKGGITIIGNTAAGCGAAVSSCQSHTCATAHAEIAPAGVGVDNDFIQTYIDIDADASTFMSSSDSLSLPSCSLISFAGLYWGAGGAIGEADGTRWSTRANAKIKINNGAYVNITADATFNNNTGYKSYHNFKDLTTVLQAAGIHARFTMANMPLLNDAGSTTNRWGGWSLVIVYRNDLQSLKNLIVFNGLTNVSSGNATTDIPLSGFLTPPTGPVNLEMGLVAYDGDRGVSASSCSSNFKGDSLLLRSAGGFVPISDARHPANDVFNSSLAINGAATLFRNPSYGNTLGFDASIFVPDNTAKNYIANNATTATIRQRTGGETYITQVVTSAIDDFEPDNRGGLTVVDLNGGTVQAGDTLEYTATIKNIGSNPSINTYVVDTFPFNCIYVPSSMREVYGWSPGNKSDVSGDDEGEFYAAAKAIKIRIGSGATAVTGGVLQNSINGADSTQVKFRVTASTDCIVLICNNVIANRFHVVGTGFISGNSFDSGSNPTIFDGNGCPVQGTTNTPITSIVCQPPTASNNSPVCIGGNINLFVQTSPNATYLWSGPNGFTSTAQNPVITGVTAVMAGAYTVTITVTGTNCVFTTSTTSITVNQTPAMTSSSSATICSGTALNIPLTASLPGTFTWIATDNVNVTGESTSLQTSSTINNTLVNTSTVPQTVTYTVIPTATTGGCPGAPQTLTVTVNPTPAVTSPASATICSGATLNIPLTASVPSSFTWIAANNPNTTGESTALQSTSTINNTLINTSLVAQTVTYTVTPNATTGGCGATAQQIVTVTVNPTPAMTSSASATICSGGTVNIPLTSSVAGTFTWVANDNTNTTGESITLQTTSTLNNTIINTSGIPQTVTYNVIPTATLGGCAGATQTVSVLVNPTPVITNQNTAAICSGGTVSIPLTSTIASTFTWIAANNSNTTGESTTLQSTSTLSNTIINTSGVPETVTYTVIATATNGGCAGASQTITVTVNPKPVMTSAISATICSGTAVNIPLTSTIPSTFTWIAANNPNTTGESTALQTTSTINNTITNNSTVPQTVTYTVIPTATSGGCAGDAQTVTVLVNPSPVMTSTNTATICSGSIVTIPLTSSVASTYTWIAGDNPNTSGESTTLQTTSTLSNTIFNPGTVQQMVTYTVIPTATQGGCSSLVPQIVTVIVNPMDSVAFSYPALTFCQTGNDPSPANSGLAGGTYTSVPAGLVINPATGLVDLSASTLGSYTITYTTNGVCPNSGTVSFSITTAPSATFSYSSQVFCHGGTNPLPILIPPAFGGTYSSTAGLVIDSNTGEIDLTASTPGIYVVTNTIAAAGGCATATATTTITINPDVIINAGADDVICSGTTYTLSGSFGGGATSVNWTTSGTGSFNNPALAGATYTPSAGDIAAGIVTLTITSNDPSGPCPSLSDNMVLTITPAVTLNPGSNATICSGTTYTLSGTFGGGASSITWTTSGSGTFDDATLPGATYTPSAADISAGSVTLTIISDDPAGPCPSLNDAMVLTINPAPVMTSTNTATICSGSIVTIPLTSSVASTYTWIAGDNPNTSGESTTLQTTSTLSNTIFNPGTVQQMVTYTVIPTATQGGCSSLVPQIVTVIVNPMDSVAFSYPALTFCQTGNDPSPANSGLAGGTYTSVPAGLVINPATGLVDLSASTLGSYTITYTTNGVCPNSGTVSFSITTAPSATFSYSSQVFCHGGTNPLPILIPPAFGGTYSSTAGLVIDSNTGEIDLTASTPGIYVVTNTIAAAGGCATATATTTITINPDVIINAGADDVICSGTTYTLSGSFGGGATSVNWTTSGTGSFNNPALAGATYTPSAGDIAAGIVTLTITSNDPSGPCPSLSDNMVLTITPAVTLNPGSNATICSGTTYTLSGTFGGGASSITWTTSGSGTFDDATLPGATYTPSAADISAGSVTLTIISDDPAGPCPSLNDAMVLTINPAATVTAGGDATICALTDYTLSGSFGGGATSGTWTSTGTGTFNNAGSPTATYNPSNADDASGSVILIYTTNDPQGVCGSVTDSMTLTITPRDNSDFSYSGGTYCQTGTNPTPTITGLQGGTFASSPAGLVIDATTGTITLLPSVLGTYSVYYTTNGPCPWTDTVLVTVTVAPSAAFIYNPATYCQFSNPNAVPSFPVGSSAGVFSASPVGLVFVNATTGVVDLNTSAPGIYTVTNYIAAAGGCAADTATNTITINPAAFVNASANDTICSGNSYTLSGSFSGGTSSITWSTSGSGTFDNSTLPNATYTPSQADITAASVVLTITSDDPSGPCSSVNDAITLYIQPAATANAGTDATICATSNYTLSGTLGGGASSATWSTTGTGTFDNNTLPNATYTPSAADDAAGSVVLVYTTNDPAGECTSVTDSITLTITPRDNSSFNYSGSTFCQSGVNPLPTITGLSGGTFSSSPGSLIINPATGEITLISSPSGTYTVMYLTNGTCPDSSTVTINITNLFVASFHYNGPYCEHSQPNPTPVYVGAGTAGTFTYHPGGLIINALTGVIDMTTTAPGTYTVINTIVGTGGCATASDSTVVTITPLDNATFSYPNSPFCVNVANPSPVITGLAGGSFSSTLGGSLNSSTGVIALPVTPGTYTITYTTNGTCTNSSTSSVTILAAPTANAGQNQQLGCGSTVTLDGTASSGGNNYTYQWTTLTGTILTGANSNQATTDAPGVYTITVTDNVTGCSETDTMTVFGIPAPVASFTTNPNPATGTMPLAVTFTNTSTNATTYLWNFGDGTTSTLENPVHVFDSVGVYPVVLYVSYNGNCIDSSEIIVVVYPGYSVIIPNVFTPNDDGVNDIFTINTTGVSELNVYIYDRWGLKIYEWHTVEGGWDGHMANGVKASDGTYFYILDLKDGDGKLFDDKGSFMIIRQ